ncbi:MAG: glycoside hydrolase family 3 protein [Spirochaetaceae bacterium]|jgi:beta-N-acetylhexosaminidase|nr:glycoside hydrolase family 3 protein [Spirochaetaceae bacterium]
MRLLPDNAALINSRAGFFFALCFLLLSAPLFSLDFYSEAPPEELARGLLEAMSDEEALAQTFMLGWKDTALGPSPLIQEWIRQRKIGAVKVFGQNTNNIEQLARAIGVFQRLSEAGAAKIPLLVATDQEGGRVRHVRDGVSESPGAMAVGASGFPEDAYKLGFFIGRELAALGINMNFAPAVDLFTNHDSELIGTRSFGDDPVKTGILAMAFARGQLAAGVIPTAKHFPGHGDTPKDSHGTLPELDVDFDTLWERELVPYRMLSKDGIPAVMTGHLAFPKTEGGALPASLSPYFIGEVLRGKLKYGGLVVTDELAMNGATYSTGSLSSTAKAAIMAGNDLIVIMDTPSLDAPVWTSLVDAMRRDEAFRLRVRDAALHVLLAKLRYLRASAAARIPDPVRLADAVPDPEAAAFYQSLAARSVTVLRRKDGGLPLPAAKAGRVLLCYPPKIEDRSLFLAAGKRAYPGAWGIWYDFNNSSRSTLLSLASEADTIVFYLEDRKEELDVLNSLRPLGKRVIVLSVLSPRSLKFLKPLSWVDGVVAIYSNSSDSIAAGFSALTGRIESQGVIPFLIEQAF